MARMPSWATTASVAALVVADVVLVSLVVLHTRGGSAAGSAAESPSESAGATDGPAVPEGSDDPERPALAVGSVLLDVASDGTVLRAGRGSCRSRADTPGATAVEISTNGGQSFASADLDPPVVDVLDVVARSSSDLSLVDVDRRCTNLVYSSTDGGSTWNSSVGTSGVWHLARVGRTRVHSPSGPSGVGCDVRAASAYARSGARVLCVDGELLGTDDGGTSWVGLGSLPGGADVTYDGPGAGWGLAATLDCPAAALRTVDGGASWEPTGCIRAQGQPQAIAATGEVVAVHVGGVLFTSTDGGVTFAEPGT